MSDLTEVRERLSRLEVKVDQVISVTMTVREHEVFITRMKERMAWIAAAFAVVGSGFTLLLNYLINHLTFGWGGH